MYPLLLDVKRDMYLLQNMILYLRSYCKFMSQIALNVQSWILGGERVHLGHSIFHGVGMLGM